MELYTMMINKTALMKFDRKRYWKNSDESYGYGSPDIQPTPTPTLPSPPTPHSPLPTSSSKTTSRKREHQSHGEGCDLNFNGLKKLKLDKEGVTLS